MCKRRRRSYSEEFKMSVLREYYSSGMTKYACMKKYKISSSSFKYWLEQYGYEKKVVSLQAKPSDDDMANRSKDSYKEENDALKKRIRELENALKFSQLETKSRDMLIEKAEEYFDIQIRKKSGAK